MEPPRNAAESSAITVSLASTIDWPSFEVPRPRTGACNDLMSSPDASRIEEAVVRRRVGGDLNASAEVAAVGHDGCSHRPSVNNLTVDGDGVGNGFDGNGSGCGIAGL